MDLSDICFMPTVPQTLGCHRARERTAEYALALPNKTNACDDEVPAFAGMTPWNWRSWRSSLRLGAGAVHLVLQHTPDIELELAELGRRRECHQVARMREGHVDDLFDPSGLRRHHHGTLAER